MGSGGCHLGKGAVVCAGCVDLGLSPEGQRGEGGRCRDWRPRRGAGRGVSAADQGNRTGAGRVEGCAGLASRRAAEKVQARPADAWVGVACCWLRLCGRAPGCLLPRRRCAWPPCRVRWGLLSAAAARRALVGGWWGGGAAVAGRGCRTGRRLKRPPATGRAALRRDCLCRAARARCGQTCCIGVRLSVLVRRDVDRELEETCFVKTHVLTSFCICFPEPPQPRSFPPPGNLVTATRSALFCLSSLHPGVTRTLLSLGGKRRKNKAGSILTFVFFSSTSSLATLPSRAQHRHTHPSPATRTALSCACGTRRSAPRHPKRTRALRPRNTTKRRRPPTARPRRNKTFYIPDVGRCRPSAMNPSKTGTAHTALTAPSAAAQSRSTIRFRQPSTRAPQSHPARAGKPPRPPQEGSPATPVLRGSVSAAPTTLGIDTL